MKIQATPFFITLLAALSLHPLVSAADVKPNPYKLATASGELVDCFYEQNAGHAACQQFRRPEENKTTTTDTAPVSENGRIAKHADKNSANEKTKNP